MQNGTESSLVAPESDAHEGSGCLRTVTVPDISTARRLAVAGHHIPSLVVVKHVE